METVNSRDGGHGHHSSWISHVIERIEDAIGELNIDFPLSGGDPQAAHQHHHIHLHHAHARTPEELEEERKKRLQWKAHLQHFLERDFPLSGGQ
jgi:hypothetical protein